MQFLVEGLGVLGVGLGFELLELYLGLQLDDS